MPISRSSLPQILVFLLLSTLSGIAAAAPSAELWPRWQAHDPASTRVIDHGAWDRWLKRHVKPSDDGINRVDYAGVDAAGRQQLKDYLRALAAIAISEYNRAEQLAYWVNLYNALTVDVVLINYPVDSIRDIRSGFFSAGPWGLELTRVEGQVLTLDDIEHRILRPIWRDPRIHYAVNCASLGCPNLQAQAFSASNSDALLDKGAREYINHPRGAQVVGGELVVSSIYEWFKSDFGGNDNGVIGHLKSYANSTLADSLDKINEIEDDRYDWRLNDVLARP